MTRSKKQIQETQQEPEIENNNAVPEEELVDESSEQEPPMFSDSFKVEIENYIDSAYVLAVEMPKMSVSIVNNIPLIEKSPIIITMLDEANVCEKLLEASQKLIKKITIKTFSDKAQETPRTTWKLENCSIGEIDFGQLSTIAKPEKRIVEFQINYDHLSIGNITIKGKS